MNGAIYKFYENINDFINTRNETKKSLKEYLDEILKEFYIGNIEAFLNDSAQLCETEEARGFLDEIISEYSEKRVLYLEFADGFSYWACENMRDWNDREQIIGKVGDEARARLYKEVKQNFDSNIDKYAEYITEYGYGNLAHAVWCLYGSFDIETQKELRK